MSLAKLFAAVFGFFGSLFDYLKFLKITGMAKAEQRNEDIAKTEDRIADGLAARRDDGVLDVEKRFRD